ncbi:MAG TPA: bifunctional transaldolase/phosoglucose isomerase [Candidatus Acidoferrum sp.]|nr:bifunctional transaldolase/phosoglucose isomerase [Candidatus Acidoferrum sp.]
MTTPALSISKETNPLRGLSDFGQSVWLDYIRRSLITSGELKRLVAEDWLRGVTSNPSIFEKAIVGSTDYEAVIESPDSAGLDAKALYEKIAIKDVQDAADILALVWEQSKGRDGYVSLEVSPLLARDTAGTLQEARRLWKAVDRKNLMVKVPATAEGIPAIRQLISEGINVNVTLLFSRDAYEQVAKAYIAGLTARAASGGDISRVASVASFFVSRIDSAIDAQLASQLKTASDPAQRARLGGLLGKVAIANAKLAYHRFTELFSGDPWKALEKNGAQPQRVLWASTSTKNPNYRDVIYVEELIGPLTVNTIPPATFNAFREHGRLRASLTEDLENAADTMDSLERAGISMKAVTDKLLEDGLKQFVEAFAKLLEATGTRRGGESTARINSLSYTLPQKLSAAVESTLADWTKNDKVRRLWRGDASLWTGADENNWLGWLGITDDQLAHIEHLTSLAAEVKKAGFAHVLLLGMGGSSLCPEVLRLTFGKIEGYPELHVLDSTDPAQIKAIEAKIDLKNTLFIVSSKSGGTLEPNIYKQYFFTRVKETIGEKEAGNRFIAITDPGSKMQHVAENDKFRHIFFGLPSIGGRYSALSNFGMVPAAAMGIDVHKFLSRTEEMVHACGATVPAAENPGVVLGAILGTLTNNGHDKVTIITSPGISDLGAWLEQLLAESTGKIGKGIVPVDREKLGKPENYGNDRIFAYLRLESGADHQQDVAVEALEKAGQPVVHIAVEDIYALGEEFFRWEIATAVAGSIIGINAFNQPDVEAAKIEARKLTNEYEAAGKLPAEEPFFEGDGVKLYADPRNAEALENGKTLAEILKTHIGRAGAGDYFALLAYVQMDAENEAALQGIRLAIRDAKKVATALGFGPRFQHSTGQAYKGGPNSGVFLQITCDDAVDLRVPDQKYTFGVVKAAQARGDLAVLAERGRRALRVHLGKDVKAGLAQLNSAVTQALA